jgi:hypothetical protein
MACDAETLMAEAAANGLTNLDDRSIVLAICGFLSNSLGGKTAGQVMAEGVAFQSYSNEQLDDAIDAHLCAQLP